LKAKSFALPFCLLSFLKKENAGDFVEKLSPENMLWMSELCETKKVHCKEGKDRNEFCPVFIVFK